MTQSPGTTAPWLTFLDTCPSTNSWTLEHQDICEHGQCVFTRHQTAGKGQRGRSWVSDPGVLTATFPVVLQEPSWAGLVPILAGLAVCETCQQTCPDARFALKWPNDVWAATANGPIDRKLAGILCEGRLRPDGSLFVAVGIGLNVTPNQNAIALHCQQSGSVPPIALSDLTISAPKPEDLLPPLRERLLEHCSNLSPVRRQVILDSFASRNVLNGAQIIVSDIPGSLVTLCGQAQGIDADGRLLVRTMDDRIVSLSAGRIRLAPPNGKELC